MRGTTTSLEGFGKVRRGVALAMLALFGHAVALHLLHGHELIAAAHASASAAAISTPHDAPARAPHSGENCPACQLQHGFASLELTPTLLDQDGAAPAGRELASPFVAQRVAASSAPSRAPPAL